MRMVRTLGTGLVRFIVALPVLGLGCAAPGASPAANGPAAGVDTDGDGIPDASDDDIDGDGIPNASDPDANGDGLPDAVIGVGSCDGTTPATDENHDCDGYCLSVEGGYRPCDDGAPPGSGGLDGGNEGEGEGEGANPDCGGAELSPGCNLFEACDVPYPYDSSFPSTSIDFNESDVLNAMTVIGSGASAQVRVFYGDEHALTLGVRHISVTSPASETDYPVTPMPAGQTAGAATDPDVGSTALTGDQAGTDPDGRPMFPSLFVTDITNDPDLCSEGHEAGCGDWQFGGTPIPPHEVFGTWKAGTRTVDGSSVQTDNDDDPGKNHSDLGAGDTAPDGLGDEGFSAELRWDVSRLGLTPGHTYRFYVMVHDGDHSADVGQGCGVVHL